MQVKSTSLTIFKGVYAESPDHFAVASAADWNVRNAHGLPLPDVTTLLLSHREVLRAPGYHEKRL